MSSSRVRELARVLWDYHVMGQEVPEAADFVLALGSHDDRVAARAAELMLEGRAPQLVASGGHGKVTKDTQVESEGHRFGRFAVEAGVPADHVLVEDQASNTGQNIVLTKALLEDRCIRAASGILVSKPYMERRSWATAMKQWPDMEWTATSPTIGFDDYPTSKVPFRRMVELMVGDLQRIELYAVEGFQIPQHIPESVWAAYEALVSMGFDRFVIPTR